MFFKEESIFVYKKIFYRFTLIIFKQMPKGVYFSYFAILSSISKIKSYM